MPASHFRQAQGLRHDLQFGRSRIVGATSRLVLDRRQTAVGALLNSVGHAVDSQRVMSQSHRVVDADSAPMIDNPGINPAVRHRTPGGLRIVGPRLGLHEEGLAWAVQVVLDKGDANPSGVTGQKIHRL